MLEGLQNLLEAHDIEVAGVAADGLASVDLACALSPDVILMDIRMPGCDGLQTTRLIKARMPQARIVILTTSDNDDDLFEAIRSGACGYLVKSIDADGFAGPFGAVQQLEVPSQQNWWWLLLLLLVPIGL